MTDQPLVPVDTGEKWMPIASAPKDGSILNVRYRGWAPYHAFWHPVYGWRPIEYDGPHNPTQWLPPPTPIPGERT